VSGTRAILSAVVAVVALGTLASPALADHIPLGVADAKTTTDSVSCTAAPPCTLAQTSSPEGSFTAPADGRIVAWWGASSGGLPSVGSLRVLRRVIPLTQVRYQAVGTSADETIDKHAAHHVTDLQVRANDLIGLTFRGFLDHEFDTGATDEHFPGAFPDGTAETSVSEGSGATDEYGAEFVFRPVVRSLDTSAGPAAGGGTLTLTGTHLTESTAVLFGSTPAVSMSVASNTGIVVPIPPGSGTVDVTVVGPGGTSLATAGDRYTYLTRSATVSPSILDFGHTLVGRASDAKSVILTNTGKVPVSIATVTLEGTDAGDFATLSNGCGGQDISAGSSCTVELAFTPDVAGARHATLHLGDNSSDGPHTVVLTGSGDDPAPPTTTTTTTTAPTITTVAPSSAFAVGRLNGTKLHVITRSRGMVRIMGRLLRASSATGGPGVVVVKLRLTGPARTLLVRRHRLTLHVRITFTPTGGTPATKVRSLLLKTT
jgi:hypothetical protein